MDQRFHLAFGDAKDCSNLAVGETLEISQHDRSAMSRGKRLEHFANAATLEVADHDGFGLGHAPLGCRLEPDEIFDRHRLGGLALSGPELVETNVGGDARDPRAQLVTTVEAAQSLVNAQERLL
jgi:hypothetical protein